MRGLAEYLRRFWQFQPNARLYLINNVLTGVTSGILLLLYNLYLNSLGYKEDFIGLVLFIGTLGGALAIFPAGLVIDRVSGKFVLLGSNALIGLAGAAQILLRGPIPLLISTFIAGVATAFILVINAPFLSINSTQEERPHLFSLNISLSLISGVGGSLLGGVMPVLIRKVPWLLGSLPYHLDLLFASGAEARAYQLTLVFAGIIAAPGFIPLLLMDRVIPERHPVPTEERSEGGKWRQIKDWIDRARHNISRASLIKVVRLPIVLLSLYWGLRGLGAGLFFPYFNLYFVKHLGASPALYGLIDGLSTTCTALLTLVAPLLARRWGPVRTIVLMQLCSLPLLLGINFIWAISLVSVFYIARNSGMNMANGLFQVFSMERVPMQQRGIANSTYYAAEQIANGVATPIGGVVIAHLGYTPVFVSAAMLYLIAIGLLWFGFGGKPYRERQKSQKLTSEEKILR